MKTVSKFTSSLACILFGVFFLLPLVDLCAASLWLKSTNRGKGLYVDKRALAVGDLLTIDVSESASLAASQNTTRNRQAQVENAVKQFLFAHW